MKVLLLESQNDYVVYYVPSTRARSCVQNGFTSIDINLIKRFAFGGIHDELSMYAVEFIFNRTSLLSAIDLHENFLRLNNITPESVLLDLTGAIQYINVRTDNKRDPISNDELQDFYPKLRNLLKAAVASPEKQQDFGSLPTFQRNDGSLVTPQNAIKTRPISVLSKLSGAAKTSSAVLGTSALGITAKASGAEAKTQPSPLGGKMNPSQMKISATGIEFIKKKEGFRSKPYNDAGKVSIGYGTNVRKGEYTSITEQQALSLMMKKIEVVENVLKRSIKVPVTQNQWDSLVSLGYNIGEGALGSSTLLKKLNSGDVQGAANEFDAWRMSEKKVNKNLVARRSEEKRIFMS